MCFECNTYQYERKHFLSSETSDIELQVNSKCIPHNFEVNALQLLYTHSNVCFFSKTNRLFSHCAWTLIWSGHIKFLQHTFRSTSS